MLLGIARALKLVTGKKKLFLPDSKILLSLLLIQKKKNVSKPRQETDAFSQSTSRFSRVPAAHGGECIQPWDATKLKRALLRLPSKFIQ